MKRNRRFYGFGSQETILKHIDGVKTLSDLAQLAFDIKQSETNLAYIQRSASLPLWGFDYSAELGPFKRHIFLESGCAIVPEIGIDCDSFTQLTH